MSTESLMIYFKFDEADLAENRRGALSPKQTARLSGERSSFRTKARVVGLIMGLASLALLGAILWSGVLGSSGILLVVIPLLFFMPLGVAAFLIFGRFASRNYSAKMEQGPIELAMRQTYNKDGTTNQHYTLRIGDQSFVTEPAISKIMTDGERYKVYYVDDWNEIVSVEHL